MDSVVLIKIVSACVYPLGLVFLFSLFAVLARWLGKKRISQILLGMALAVLLLFSNPGVASWLAASLEQQFPPQPLAKFQTHDAVLVLGGGLRLPLPPSQRPQLATSADRYWFATSLFRAGRAKRVLLSGGNAIEQPGVAGEVVYAARLLQQWGVPQDAILIESNSRTTEQNVRAIVALAQREKIHSVLLVTSAMHMPRAMAIFESASLRITPAVADVLVLQQQTPRGLAWLPSAAALQLSTRALHEYYGLAFFRIKDLIERG